MKTSAVSLVGGLEAVSAAAVSPSAGGGRPRRSRRQLPSSKPCCAASLYISLLHAAFQFSGTKALCRLFYSALPYGLTAASSILRGWRPHFVKSPPERAKKKVELRWVPSKLHQGFPGILPENPFRRNAAAGSLGPPAAGAAVLDPLQSCGRLS